MTIEPATSTLPCCPSKQEVCATLVVPVIVGRGAATDLVRQLVASAVDDEPNPCWLVVADYTIHYNQHHLLSMTFRESGVGAYPSTNLKRLTIDVRTGRPLSAAAFDASQQAKLATMVDASVQQALSQSPMVEGERLSGEYHFVVDSLNDFIVTEQGIVFVFDFETRHVNRVLTPLSEHLVAWSDLRGFIAPKSPLAEATRARGQR